MKITLDSLAIRSFKGIKEYTLKPEGKNLTLTGQNGTCKTTLYDAFLFCLFGKDSTGRTDFELRPLDENNLPLKEVVVAVTTSLTLDGQAMTLAREQHENIIKDKSYGYTGKYFVDGVPKKESEYKATVKGIITEDVFRMLTDLSCFCGKMHWSDRRSILLDIAGDIGTPEGFDELLKTMSGKSIADYKAMLLSQKKGYVTKRDEIPTRIDEKQRSAEKYIQAGDSEPELIAKREDVQQAIDTIADLRKTLTDNEAQRQEHIDEKNDLGSKLAVREGELSMPGGDIQEVIDEKYTISKDLNESRDTVQALKNRVAAEAMQVQSSEDALKHSQLSLGSVREEYIALKNIALADTCYACSQSLPDRLLAENQLHKEKQILALSLQGTQIKQSVAATRTNLDVHLTKLVEAKTSLTDAEYAREMQVNKAHLRRTELDEVIKNRPAPDFTTDAKWQELTTAIEKCETEIGPPVNTQLAQLDARKQHAEKELTDLNASLANIDQIEKDRKRIEELHQEQREFSQSISDIDKELEEVDCYTVQESLSIELAVNDKFKDVQFKLFEYLQNGTVNDKRCDATLHGVPYSSLSTGEQRKVETTVINGLSKHYNVWPVLWIDNAESLTLPLEINTQTIKLKAADMWRCDECGIIFEGMPQPTKCIECGNEGMTYVEELEVKYE